LSGFITILEKNNNENGSDNGNQDFDVRGLGKSEGIEEISLQQ
jgi:hypothetical protein